MLAILASIIVALLVLYIPGFLLMRAVGVSNLVALSAAPIYPMLLIPSVGLLLSFANIKCNALIASFALFFIPLLCVILRVFVRRSKVQKGTIFGGLRTPRYSKAVILASYVALGILVGSYVFLQPVAELGTPIQSYDSIFHFNLVRHYIEDPDWSILHASVYKIDEAFPTPGTFLPNYYPAGWHLFCAFLVQLTHFNSGIIEIATLFSFSSIVFPIGIFAFLSVAFKDDSRLALCGAICAPAFASYPWILMVTWPLYPFMVSTSLVPSFVCAVIWCTRIRAFRKRIIGVVVAILVGLLTFAYVQPSSLFTSFIFFGAYGFHLFYSSHITAKWKDRFGSKGSKVLAVGISFCVFALIWLLAYSAPFLESVVQYYWAPIASKKEELINILLLSYTGYALQPFLAFLVILGTVYFIRHKGHIWIILPYAFSIAALFACATLDNGEIEHILAGFWYTDPYRVSAVAAVCAIPLASAGINALLLLGEKVLSAHGGDQHPFAMRAACAFTLLLISLLIFFPWRLGESCSPFLKLHDQAAIAADANNAFYSKKEQDFVNSARQYVEEGNVVLNQPFDGSAVAYGIDGLNTYFRRNNKYTDDHLMINRVIDDAIASNRYDDISKEIIDATNATFFLTLGRAPEEFSHFPNTYSSSQWSGIDALDESITGFELILSDGDMALYRITDTTQ